MHWYTAHGLCLASELAFPNLLSCTTREADVTIRFGHVDALRDSSTPIASGENFCITAAGTFIFQDGVGSVLMRSGREIVIESQGTADERILSAFVLDFIPTLLHQRGRFVLHASALEIGGGAVAFMGESGLGKSTLALTLYERGCPLITDDLISIDLTGDFPMVIPSYPELNVWPETLTALSHDPSSFQRVRPGSEKRAVPTLERFAKHPLPLRLIYLLIEGKITCIESLPPREATFVLVRHSFRPELPEGSSPAIHLSQCAQLARTIPVRCVKINQTPDSIESLAQLVEADARETLPRAASGLKTYRFP